MRKLARKSMLLTLCTAMLLTCFAPFGKVLSAESATQTFSEGNNQVKVILLAEDVVRIRVGPGGSFQNDLNNEYVVIKPDSRWSGAADLDVSPDVINTGKLKMVFKYKPLSVSVYGADGKALLSNYTFDFTSKKAVWSLDTSEHIYGFGDTKCDIDKRGTFMDVWNVDTDKQESGYNSYKSVPMYWSSKGYGMYLHNWWRSGWDIGKADVTKLQVAADGGEMDFYMFYGPSFKQIVNRYTELTGRPALLPKWAYGFQQGGASNDTSEAWAENIAAEMRKNKLPLDVVYYDDWDPEVFTQKFVNNIWNKHHIKISAGLGLSMASSDEELWSKLIQFSPKKGIVVNSSGMGIRYFEDGFDSSSDIDYFNPEVCDFVFDEVWKGPLSAGVWSGMSDFGELDFVPNAANAYFPYFDNPKRSVEELHNIYGLMFGEQMIERAAEFKKSRKIGMTRSGTAGSQRIGWTWTADSTCEWGGTRGLQAHTKAMLNLSMSGFSNIGFDIGGWMGVSSDEKYVRWFQAGMFNPYAAAHGEGDHTIFGAHPEVMDICREALNMRYQLMPYIYSLGFEANQTGCPINRTIAFETNGEKGTENINDEWFFGPSMLVAPVLEKSYSKMVTLPAGQWVDYNDGKTVYTGPTTFKYAAPLNKVPIFIKVGSIIPMSEVMQYTSEKPINPLILDMYPSLKANASFELFEDDGIYGYENGKYSTTKYECSQAEGISTITMNARNSYGKYTPGERNIKLQLHNQKADGFVVKLNGVVLNSGCSYDPVKQLVTIQIKDTGVKNIINVAPVSK